MKSLKTLIGIALATTTLGGAIAMGAVATNSTADSFQIAEAASTTSRFFLDCTQHTGYDNEQSIGIQYYNGSYVKKEATKLEDNYWYVDDPNTNLTKVQFFRCDTGNTGKNYNWQWEGNPAEVNYYAGKGWDNNGTWSSVGGVDETYEVASTSASASTKRIWLNPKDNFYDGNARAALRVFNNNGHVKTHILGGSSQYTTVNGQMLFYVDIAVNDGCQLVRLHNKFNCVWTYGSNITEIPEYNTAKVVYSWAADAGYSAANEGTATVAYAKLVLDGYQTCDSSAVNGYGNYANIKTQVLDKLSASDLNTLKASTFTAPTYGTRTYGEKITWMSSKSGSGSRQIGEMVNNNSSVVAIVALSVSVALVSAVGIFFTIRKKKAI